LPRWPLPFVASRALTRCALVRWIACCARIHAVARARARAAFASAWHALCLSSSRWTIAARDALAAHCSSRAFSSISRTYLALPSWFFVWTRTRFYAHALVALPRAGGTRCCAHLWRVRTLRAGRARDRHLCARLRAGTRAHRRLARTPLLALAPRGACAWRCGTSARAHAPLRTALARILRSRGDAPVFRATVSPLALVRTFALAFRGTRFEPLISLALAIAFSSVRTSMVARFGLPSAACGLPRIQ